MPPTNEKSEKQSPFKKCAAEVDLFIKETDGFLKELKAIKTLEDKDKDALLEKQDNFNSKAETLFESVNKLDEKDEPGAKMFRFDSNKKGLVKKIETQKTSISTNIEKLTNSNAKLDKSKSKSKESLKGKKAEKEADDEVDVKDKKGKKEAKDDEKEDKKKVEATGKDKKDEKKNANESKAGASVSEDYESYDEDEDYEDDDDDSYFDETQSIDQEVKVQSRQLANAPSKETLSSNKDVKAFEKALVLKDTKDGVDFDSEGSDYDEDYTDEEDEADKFHRTFITERDWVGTEKDDLSFKKDEILYILEAKGDWWLARNSKGQEGDVPKNFLRVYIDETVVKSSDDKSEAVDDSTIADTMTADDAVGDLHANASNDSENHRSGKELWHKFKHDFKQITLSDVAEAFGALPDGFRVSTTGNWYNNGNNLNHEVYTNVNYLAPKLNQSNVSFGDLQFDTLSSKIRPRNVKFQRMLLLQKAMSVPTLGTQAVVVSRHVRMCLFDGVKPVSNIISVCAQATDKDLKTWTFNSRINDALKLLDCGETFVRFNHATKDVGILLEVCYQCVKNKSSFELSIGYVVVPLEEGNAQCANKVYELELRGGTPLEKELKADGGAADKSGISKKILEKPPKLIFKIYAPSKETKDTLDFLPDVICGSLLILPFHSYYRHHLADALLRDRHDVMSTESIHSPLLARYPSLAEEYDLMDAFRQVWNERFKALTRNDKKDTEILKSLFGRVFMESIYPISILSNFPSYKLFDDENTKERNSIIQKFLIIAKKGILEALLSEEFQFSPMFNDEICFNINGPYCLFQSVAAS